MIPNYLQDIPEGGIRYGQLRYDAERQRFVIQGNRQFLLTARRMFPGADNGRQHILFDATRRAVGDLYWLMQRYPLEVLCPDELAFWRAKAVQHAERRESNQQLDPMQIPAAFVGKLLDYQALGVPYLIKNERTILADEMGLGKTWTALAAAATVGEYPILVVCGTQVTEQWQWMIGHLFRMGQDDLLPIGTTWDQDERRGQRLATIVHGMKPYALPETPFVICHYGLLAAWWQTFKAQQFKVIIFDEIQELRHSGTQKYSAASDLAASCNWVWGLSGTPIYGYGMEIWNVCNIIDFHCLGSSDAFSRAWCTGYGEKIVQDPEALGDYLRSEGLMLRRRAKDVQTQLPPVHRKLIDVEHDRDQYAQLMIQAVDTAQKVSSLHWYAKGKAVREVDRLSRYAAGMSKVHAVARFIVGLIEAGERPLVFAWHHDVHDVLIEFLRPYGVAIITGRQTPKQKREAKRCFMRGDAQAVLLSLRTTAGIDGLQQRATCAVMAELDWSPAVMAQAETRIARMGVSENLEEVPSFYCVSDTGYDQVMLDVLGLKTGQFVGIMGDEPESAEDRRAQEEAVAHRLLRLVSRLTGNTEAELVDNPYDLHRLGQKWIQRGEE